MKPVAYESDSETQTVTVTQTVTENRAVGTSPRLNSSADADSDVWYNTATYTSPYSNGSHRSSNSEGMASTSSTQSPRPPRALSRDRRARGHRHSLVERMMQSESGLGIGFELPGTPYEAYPKSMMSSRVSSMYSVTGSTYSSSGDEADDARPSPKLVEF